jgi:large subunit ribosomal protein L25
MEKVKLEVEKRTDTGKRARNALRASGYIPGTLYGKDFESLSVQVKGEALGAILKDHGAMNMLLELSVIGDKRLHPTVLIRQMQRDPVTRRVLNIDFHRISMTQRITTVVPVSFSGEPAGVHHGGLLEHVRDQVEVSCLPEAIPDSIEVDISNLEINEHISAQQLPLPDGVQMVTHSEELIVAVRPKPVQVEEVVEKVEVEGAEEEAEPAAEAEPEEGAEGAS